MVRKLLFAFLAGIFLIAQVGGDPPSTTKKEPDKKEPSKDDRKELPGTPVITPKKPDDHATAEPVVNADQASMPLNLIRNRVDTIKVGTSVYVVVGAVRVDSNRKCWLHPNYLTGTKSPERIVQIKRDAAGYHLTLEHQDYQWEAEDVEGNTLNWIPVKSIVVRQTN